MGFESDTFKICREICFDLTREGPMKKTVWLFVFMFVFVSFVPVYAQAPAKTVVSAPSAILIGHSAEVVVTTDAMDFNLRISFPKDTKVQVILGGEKLELLPTDSEIAFVWSNLVKVGDPKPKTNSLLRMFWPKPKPVKSQVMFEVSYPSHTIGRRLLVVVEDLSTRQLVDEKYVEICSPNLMVTLGVSSPIPVQSPLQIFLNLKNDTKLPITYTYQLKIFMNATNMGWSMIVSGGQTKYLQRDGVANVILWSGTLNPGQSFTLVYRTSGAKVAGTYPLLVLTDTLTKQVLAQMSVTLVPK